MRPTDIVTQIHWFDADSHRPPCTGTYLTAFSTDSITSMRYSKKHDAFNCDDDDYATHIILHPAYWAFMPDTLTEILEEIWRETH